MSKENETPRQVITAIRRDYGIREDGSQDEAFYRISRNLKNSIEQLSTGLYEKENHFVLELIQNAEDNDYQDKAPDLRFVVLEDDPTQTPDSDGCLCVFNNEAGFKKKHVESISQIGESTKTKKQGYIGEKGIGFKSVFIVSSMPHIYSNGYSFKFKERDPDIELSYIVPYWLDSIPNIVTEDNANTAILLPLKQGMKANIVAELKRIKPETILFLSKLEGLSVDIRSDLTAIDLARDKSHAPIIELLIQQKNEETVIHQYWLHTDTVNVPDDIKEEKRKDVLERQITIAFPLESNSSTGTIYAFLPTEVDSGLPFLVNADFILTANRESIQSDRRWNIWLSDELAYLVVQGLVEISKSKDHRKSLYGLIPLINEIKSLKEYFTPACEEVHARLASMEIVLSDKGELIVPSNVRLATKPIRNLFDGKSRPTAFNDFSFVDAEIEKHANRLKAIGVKSFQLNDLKRCLLDEEWLSDRKIEWFLDFYKYLNSSNKKYKRFLKKLSVIPIQNGKRVSPSQYQVYFPADHDLVKKLEKRLSTENSPEIAFLDEQLFLRLTKNKELLEWARRNLTIEEFSFSTYVGSTLVPWLYKQVDEINEKDLLSSVQIILENWQEITEEDREVISEKMPVLLDDGSIVRTDKLEGKELLVPRTLDKDKGWQLILKTEEDYGHEDVLSDNYLNIGDHSYEHINEFFNVIHAESFPDLREVSFSRYQTDNDPYSKYVSFIFDAFNEGYTTPPQLTTWLTPLFFHDDAKRKNKKNRRALIYWLEAMQDTRSESLGLGKLNWFYYSPRSISVDSGLYFYLTNTSWISTTKGLKRPGEVFVKTKQISEMFGAKLAYLKEEISSALCEFLGIKTEVTTETVLDYLRELSKREEVDIKLIKQLYTYLDDYGDEYEDYFRNEDLIYIPDSEKCWYVSSEVIWDDASQVLNELYGWLSPVYETGNLKQFFLNKISISETVQNEDLARAWLQLPERNDLSAKEIEASLSKIYPRLLDEINRSDDRDSWWEEFVDEAMLWTQDDDFVDKDAVFVPDDYYLRNLFSEELAFVWKPESLTHNKMGALYDELGITRLSEGIQAYLENPGEAEELESPVLLTEHSKRLLCYMIYNDSSEDYEELMLSGVLKDLLQSVEAETDSITIRYDVTDSFAHKTVSNRHAFWEPTQHLLYLRCGSEDEDLLDDTVEVIARALWGAVYKYYEDHVRTTLAITTESRFKKLRDKKGWHLPPDVRKEANRLIGESGQQQLEEDSESFEEVDHELDTQTEEEGQSTGGIEENEDSESIAGHSDQAIRDVGGREENGHWQGEDQKPDTQTEKERESIGGIGGNDDPESTAGHSGRARREVGGERGQKEAEHQQGGRSGRAGLGSSSASSSENEANATGNSSGTQGSRGRSRSRNTTEKINRQNQSRVVTYIYPRQEEHESSDSDSKEKQAERKAIGDAAEEYVRRDEEQNGRKARRMPENNPGYDVESIDPETGDIRFIEVKGIDGVWGERGVGISYTQYNTAREKGGAFWLYVVERARTEKPEVHRINNPAEAITEYRFDNNWAALASRRDDLATPPQTEDELVQELIELTDNKVCQSIIAYCYQNKLPVPEVGFETFNEQGGVTAEVELAWPGDKLAVLIEEETDFDRASLVGWKFISCNEMEGNIESLKELIGE